MLLKSINYFIMFVNEYTSSIKLNQYLQTQASLLKKISSIIKSTQNSVLQTSSLPITEFNSKGITSSLLNLNTTLNEYLSQLVTKRTQLETKVCIDFNDI